MKRNLQVVHGSNILYGCEHVPDVERPRVGVIVPGHDGTKVGPLRLLYALSSSLEAAGIASFRFDLAGTGESTGVPSLDQVEQTSALLRLAQTDLRFSSQRPFLIGFSLGAYMAALAAVRQPQPAQMVLISPTFNMPDIGRAVLAGSDPTKERVPFAGRYISRTQLGRMMDVDLATAAAGFPGKVLVVSGSADTLAPANGVHEWCNRLYGSNATHLILSGAKHLFSHWTWQEQIIALATRFVRDGAVVS